MRYRLATAEDILDLTKCITAAKVHGVVDASELDGIVAVIEHETKIIACVWGMICGRHCYSDYMSVLPEHQHRGLGPKLLVWFMKVLRDHGVQHLRFTVPADNVEAHRVYDALGASFGSNYDVGYKRIWAAA